MLFVYFIDSENYIHEMYYSKHKENYTQYTKQLVNHTNNTLVDNPNN